MLGGNEAVPNIPVKNLEAAREFYEGKLGLQPVDREGDDVIVFKSGGTRLYVYRSEHAGTNQATTLTWSVGDIDEEVRNLKDKGIRFEHYELPGVQQQGDLHVSGDMKIAWFKDPDGNILALANA